jgi:hypothetical protein
MGPQALRINNTLKIQNPNLTSNLVYQHCPACYPPSQYMQSLIPMPRVFEDWHGRGHRGRMQLA